MTRNENEMLYKFFLAQWKYPSKKNEWTTKVREDLKELSIEDNLDDIKKISKHSFKNIVKKKIVQEAFNHLMRKKDKQAGAELGQAQAKFELLKEFKLTL